MKDMEEYAELCKAQSMLRQQIRHRLLQLLEIDQKLKKMDKAVLRSTNTDRRNVGNYEPKGILISDEDAKKLEESNQRVRDGAHQPIVDKTTKPPKKI